MSRAATNFLHSFIKIYFIQILFINLIFQVEVPKQNWCYPYLRISNGISDKNDINILPLRYEKAIFCANQFRYISIADLFTLRFSNVPGSNFDYIDNISIVSAPFYIDYMKVNPYNYQKKAFIYHFLFEEYYISIKDCTFQYIYNPPAFVQHH